MKGLNSIILINSMKVDRAEIQTFGNVMLTGENDAGKTAALRLWVYFITGDRDMLGLDKNQDFCTFYFPKSNSYIIYELFNEENRFMIILYCKNNIVFSRYVDIPYKREYFFDEQNKAYDRWEDIADKIGRKANEFGEVRGEQNFCSILFGNVRSYQHFSLVRSSNSLGLRKAVQGVFLNKELVETRTIRDFILEALSLSSTSVEITKLKQLIQPVREQYRDIEIWNKEENGRLVKQIEAKQVVTTYKKIIDKEVSISILWKKLNYITPRNSKLRAMISESIQHQVEQRDTADKELKQLRAGNSSRIAQLQEPITRISDTINQLEQDNRRFNDNKVKAVLDLFLQEEKILTAYQSMTEEYRLLTSATDDIERKYKDMLATVITPLAELKASFVDKIRQEGEAYKLERLKIGQDYEAECKKIEAEHAEIISSLTSAIRERDTAINKLWKELAEYEGSSLYKEEKINLTKEREQRETAISNITNDLNEKELAISNERNAANKEVAELKLIKIGGWKQSVQELGKQIDDIKSTLEKADGSLLQFLENQIPGWEATIGKVIADDVLFSQGTSPSVADGNSLYGVQLDLDKIDRAPVTIDALQKQVMALEKQKATLESYIQNPDIALQGDIYKIEEPHSRKIGRLTKDKEDLAGQLATEKSKLEKVEKDFEALEKKERAAKENKRRSTEEQVGGLEKEKQELEVKITEENGESGRLGRLAVAAKSKDLLLQQTEEHQIKQQQYQEQAENLEKEIAAKSDEINKMKLEELSSKGIDTKRLTDLQEELAKVGKQREVLLDKKNIELNIQYQRFISEYSKMDYYQHQLSLAHAALKEYEEQYTKEQSTLESRIKGLDSSINSDKGRLSAVQRELEEVLGYQSEGTTCPSFLMSNDFEETDEKGTDLIKAINDSVVGRLNELQSLKDRVNAFVRVFSINNIYGIKKVMSVGDDSNRDYCAFASWLEDFITNKRWEQNEEVSFTQYNDIIKEAASECGETQRHLQEIDKVISDMNKQLSSLNFSKIDFIEFQRRNSGNEIFKIIEKIRDFYIENQEVIEQAQTGLFAQNIPIDDIRNKRKDAINLVHKLAETLTKSNVTQLSVRDTFDLDVRGSENGNSIPWTMSFTTFGSKGTSFVARTLINIVLIDVFKKKLGTQQDFIIHCVMDEIGQLDADNRKGIMAFSNKKNVYLVQAAPDTMNGSDYGYVYFIQNIQGKCKFNKIVNAE